MLAIPQSTSKVVVFKAYLASDHVTEATGKTIAITISKNGGAFGNPSAGATNATGISSGWYSVTLSTTDTNTLGPLAIRGAEGTIDDVGTLYEVVSATTGGLTNLDAAISSRMATYTQPTGFLAATFPTGTIANTTNQTAGTVTTVSGNVNGSVGSVTGLTASNLDATISSRLASASYTTPPTVVAIADQVWDETLSGHLGAGSTGAALNGAGAAGDPWTTALPGAYGAGTAGNIIGNNINATVSSRATQTSVDTLDDFVDTEIAAIKAKTDSLNFTVAGRVDANIRNVNNVAVTGVGTLGNPWGP